MAELFELNTGIRKKTSLDPGLGAGDVIARFSPYKFAEPKFDLEEAILDRLGLQGYEMIVDVGDYGGSLLMKLRNGHRHNGRLIGVNQNHHPIMQLREVQSSGLLYYVPRDEYGRDMEGSNTDQVTASAQDLPGGDNSVDVLTALFMMYFVDEADQAQVLEEFKRVLKPDGKCVIATSGKSNKMVHREFERRIAKALGVKPPELMNKRFNSERASIVLPQHFSNVYHCSYSGIMRFHNLSEAEAYYHSLLSMKDFFDPPIEEETAAYAFDREVQPVIEAEIERVGSFVDYVERDLFICSNHPDGLIVNEPSGGINVHGYVRKYANESNPARSVKLSLGPVFEAINSQLAHQDN